MRLKNTPTISAESATPRPSIAYVKARMLDRNASGKVGSSSAAGTDATTGGTTGSSHVPNASLESILCFVIIRNGT